MMDGALPLATLSRTVLATSFQSVTASARAVLEPRHARAKNIKNAVRETLWGIDMLSPFFRVHPNGPSNASDSVTENSSPAPVAADWRIKTSDVIAALAAMFRRIQQLLRTQDARTGARRIPQLTGYQGRQPLVRWQGTSVPQDA